MGVTELLLKRKEELATRNQQEGDQYRLAYAMRNDVIKLPNGLLYEIIVEGCGEQPLLSDQIHCHYHGTNVRGEVFDSSVVRGQPATFSLLKLIKAWQLIIPMTKVGTKFKMVVPPELAYRDQQLTKEIGPNSTLIFEIELLEIVNR